jgi:carbonic anhydrase
MALHGTSRERILEANARYAARLRPPTPLPPEPAQRLAILTCMDARLDPLRFAGLREGDAHVIRNAGGRASDDAIRSLVVSAALLGTREWLVVHHTGCGLAGLTEAEARERVQAGLRQTGQHVSPARTEAVDWLAMPEPAQALVDDVRRIRAHPLVPDAIPVSGWVIDVASGLLAEVPEATAAGRPLGAAAAG